MILETHYPQGVCVWREGGGIRDSLSTWGMCMEGGWCPSVLEDWEVERRPEEGREALFSCEEAKKYLITMTHYFPSL